MAGGDAQGALGTAGATGRAGFAAVARGADQLTSQPVAFDSLAQNGLSLPRLHANFHAPLAKIVELGRAREKPYDLHTRQELQRRHSEEIEPDNNEQHRGGCQQVELGG